ncbi:uncharacterized protein JCM15063_000540 [Sporobolomyces koalae]|uniref:uncharacterized protein n=1 Tax=Sporobolomyces koalae TaxID=500713 RepID=UPI003177B2CE
MHLDKDAQGRGAGKASSSIQLDRLDAGGADLSKVTTNASSTSRGAPPPVEFESYPDGGFQAWVQVAAGSLLFSISLGGIYLWGVLQEGLVAAGAGTAAQLAWVGSAQASVAAVFAIPLSRIVSALGARRSALIGSLFITLSPLLASFTTHNLAGLALTSAIIFGFSQGLMFFAALQTPPSYFLKRRNVAAGIIYAGAGIGSALLSIVVGQLLEHISIEWTLRVLSLIYALVAFPSAMVLRSKLPKKPFRTGGPVFDKAMFKDKRFCFLLLGTSIALFPLFVPPFFLPLFATSVGLSSTTSSYLLAGYNLSSAGGRIAFGLFADSLLGSLNSLLLCLAMVTISTLAIWPFAMTIAPLIIFAIVNGFCAGGLFSLMPGVITSLFGQSKLSVIFSMLISAWSFGYFLGSPIAGYLLQAGGGPEGGIAAFRGAIWYAGGLSAVSTGLIAVVKALQVKKERTAAQS